MPLQIMQEKQNNNNNNNNNHKMNFKQRSYNFIFLNVLFMVLLTIMASCSRSEFTSLKDDVDKIFFLYKSEQTGKSINETMKEHLSLTNKKLVLLPVYGDLEYNKTMRQNDLAQILNIIKNYLSKLDIKVTEKIYADYTDYSVGSDEFMLINQFQTTIYSASLSDKSLSVPVSGLYGADLILNTQVDYWPDAAIKEKNQIRIQMRLIDGESGLIMWHGIDFENSPGAGQNFALVEKIIKNLLLDLKSDF